MRRFAVAVVFLLATSGAALAGTSKKGAHGKREPDEKRVTKKCTWNGIKLHGKVQIVDAFPDIKVQVVDAFPDLKVRKVDAFPDDCGEWQIVDAFPDFKIQIVDAFPDVKIQYVDAFPGLP
ncbi:MAG TPA: hypothetical protein VMV18_09245 [bacterium]|nr:hypothetical protein [bacterium]